MREDIEKFIPAALEASIYFRPREPGLTVDEIREIAALAGFKRGQVEDALKSIFRYGVPMAGSRHAPLPAPGISDFVSAIENDHRNPQAFQFVREHLKELAAEYGRAKARISRDHLVAAGADRGLDSHDIEVAIALLLLSETVEAEGDEIVHTQRNDVYAMPLRQLEQTARMGARMPVRKRPLFDESYHLLREFFSTRHAKLSTSAAARGLPDNPEPAVVASTASSVGHGSATRDKNHEVSQVQKPRIFIGSSVEGKSIAEHIQLGLHYDAECTIWWQGVFGLSSGTLESLIKASKEYEFAVLVLTPDDLVHKRDAAKNSPRDNVLFELGLFMGALGRERTYIVYCHDDKPDLPTDLAGVTPATFAKRADGNLQGAMGPVCTQIKNAIKAVHAAKLNP